MNLTITRFVLPLVIVASSGCASTIGAIANRPITSDKLDEYNLDGTRKDINKLKTLSGDRRLVRVQRADQRPKPWHICAETQADAIAARGAQSTLTVSGQGAGTDQTTESLLLTNARSELSDVIRQLAWQICNAHLNGAYADEVNGYAQRLDKLQHDAMVVLLSRSEKPRLDLLAPAFQKNVSVTFTYPALVTPPPEPPAECKPTPDKPCPAK